MANLICIEEVYKPSSDLWGFHAYDDYESCEAFNWATLPENDLDWFYDMFIQGYPEAFGEMIQFAREAEKGIQIRGHYYEWSELEPIYVKARAASIG